MPYKDREKQRGYQNEWIKKRRLAWIAKQGGKCVICGSPKDVCIANLNVTTTHRVWSWSIPRLEAALVGSELRCRTCHRVASGRLSTNHEKVHGTQNRYRKGCRCLPCCTAMAKQRKEKRLRMKDRKMDKKAGFVNEHDFGALLAPIKRCKRCWIPWQRRKEPCVSAQAEPLTLARIFEATPGIEPLCNSTPATPDTPDTPFEGEGGAFGGGGASTSWEAPDTSDSSSGSDSSCDSGSTDSSSSDSGGDSGGGVGD